MYEILAVLGGFALIYSAVAGGVERTWISGPIVFVALGVLLGPVGVGLLAREEQPELLMALAELTLALVLFADAAGANLGVLRQARKLPVRLLAIGLPLTILLGFGVGALGKAVVSNEAVPDKVREGLSVESGLNDGICVPILFLFLALAKGQGDEESPLRTGLVLFLEEVGIGAAAGVVVAVVAVLVLRLCKRRGWLSPTWTKITVVAAAFACFGTAQALGGSGFIASFIGGMLFGRLLKPHHEELLESAEGIGDTFALLTWVLFGAAVVGQAVGNFSWSPVLYAVLSLTVIRMLPVFVCLTGLRGGPEGKLFVGWFGPRGLASIVFAVIVINANVPSADTISAVVTWTVLLSVIAHGVSANPWAKSFGARSQHLDGPEPDGGEASDARDS
ncbi:MAG: cation:proton antiporter domain-containing protein [Planctomycetota bacterium]|jgi:NhaP-type Na+/H+ or K+/H+ antiporter